MQDQQLPVCVRSEDKDVAEMRGLGVRGCEYRFLDVDRAAVEGMLALTVPFIFVFVRGFFWKAMYGRCRWLVVGCVVGSG